MDLNNPFKDLDKKLFKDNNSSKNPDNANKAQNKKNSSFRPNTYSSKSKYSSQTIKQNNDNHSNQVQSLDDVSDEELFLNSMQSTIKTSYLNKDNIENNKKNKQKQIHTTKDKTLDKNTNQNTIKEQEKADQLDFNNLSGLLNSKVNFQNKNQVLKQEFDKKPAFFEKNLSSTHHNQKNETSEEEDFIEAMSGVKPLDNDNIMLPEVEEFIVQNDQSSLIFDYEDGKKEFALNYTDDFIQCNILGLDLLILAQLQNRHYNPEACIDLHGLNSRQAFDALIPFFKNAYFKDMRSLLIITGKGKNSLEGRAVLRSKVCDWLIQEPFMHLVIAFCTAQIQDGGNGALYVLLRKRKKNSKNIAWDRLPNDYDLWANLDK